MKKLLIGSHNPAKVKFFKMFLADLGFKIVSLDDLKIKKDVKENGQTFLDNTIKKVNCYSKLTGLPTIADDGGLEIDYLNGAPGVKSRRWQGWTMSDQEMIDYTLKKLEGVPWSKRKARLLAIVALEDPVQKKIHISQAFIKGIIHTEISPKRIKGFPFRSIFWVPKFKKYFVDLTKKELNTIDHRKKALKKLKPILKKLCST